MSRLSQLLATFTPEELAALEVRFWSKVDRRGTDDCWLWKAASLCSGYGTIKIRGRFQARAHCLAHLLFHPGDNPSDNLMYCHSCDVRYPVGDITYRRCVNPAHLWLGTSAQNTKDAALKGRMATGDRNASRLYPERLPRGDDHWRRKYPERNVRGDAAYFHSHIVVGERHPRAKLTDAQAEEILVALETRGNEPVSGVARRIATRFGISAETVRAMHQGRVWAHLRGKTNIRPRSYQKS